jgi:tripartite-type tricarboxylate transporter receptor subunit TctC
MASTPFILVTNPPVSASSIKELVTLAKSTPGQIKYGSVGSGSPPHLAAEIFKSITATDIVHVPYKSGTPALNDTVAGHVQMSFSVIPACIALVKARRPRHVVSSSSGPLEL